MSVVSRLTDPRVFLILERKKHRFPGCRFEDEVFRMIQTHSHGVYQRLQFSGTADFTQYPFSLRAEIKKTPNNTLMGEDFLAKIPVSDGVAKVLNQIAAEHGEKLKQFFAAKGKPMTVTPQAWAMAEFRRSIVLSLKLGQEPDEQRILRDIRKSFTTPEKTLVVGPRS